MKITFDLNKKNIFMIIIILSFGIVTAAKAADIVGIIGIPGAPPVQVNLTNFELSINLSSSVNDSQYLRGEYPITNNSIATINCNQIDGSPDDFCTDISTAGAMNWDNNFTSDVYTYYNDGNVSVYVSIRFTFYNDTNVSQYVVSRFTFYNDTNTSDFVVGKFTFYNDTNATNAVANKFTFYNNTNATLAILLNGTLMASFTTTFNGTYDTWSFNQTTPSSNYVTRSDWTTHNNYPADCGAGDYSYGIGDTLSCRKDWTGNTSTQINSTLNIANWDSAYNWGNYRTNSSLWDLNKNWLNQLAWSYISNPPAFITASNVVFSNISTAFTANVNISGFNHVNATNFYQNGNPVTGNSSIFHAFNKTYNTWAYNQTTPAINYITGLGYITSSNFGASNTSATEVKSLQSVNTTQEARTAVNNTATNHTSILATKNVTIANQTSNDGWVIINSGQRYCMNPACSSYITSNSTHSVWN